MAAGVVPRAGAATTRRSRSGMKSEVRAPTAVGMWAMRVIGSAVQVDDIDEAFPATYIGAVPFRIDEHVIGIAAG